MAKNENQLAVLDDGDEQAIQNSWMSDSIPPIVLKAAMEAAGMPATVTPAESLVGQTVVLRSAKKFRGRYPEQGYDPYFVTGVIKKTGEVFGSVFGGVSVVELLDRYIASGQNAPLECTLVENEGGQYGRYYTLE